MKQGGTTDDTVANLRGMAAGVLLGIVAFAGLVATLGADIPPRVSNSLSFNAKARWLGSASRCDILILGSSMALNNLDGPELERHFPGYRVANAGSWGLRPSEDLRLMSRIGRKCMPRVVVMPLYFGDFSGSERSKLGGKEADWKDIDWDSAGRVIQGGSSLLPLIKELDAGYLIDSYLKLHSPQYSTNRHYNSLVFDSTGGALLSDNAFNVDPKRWNGYHAKSREVLIAREIDSLERLVHLAVGSGVKVVVVRTPMTSDAASALEGGRFGEEWSRIEMIVTRRGGLFVDLSDLKLSDSLFADFCHLRETGARVATSALAARAKGYVMGLGSAKPAKIRDETP
jgi:hypothetical protein